MNIQNEINVPSTEDFVQNIANNIKKATGNLGVAQRNQAKYADKHRRDNSFQVGNKVMLATKNITLDTQSWRLSRKFQPRYIGPYEVIEVISPVNYRLKLPHTVRIHPVFHVSLLKKYIENDKEFSERIVKPPPPVVIDDQEEYKV